MSLEDRRVKVNFKSLWNVFFLCRLLNMDGEDVSVSERFFRFIANCQILSIEREREINSGQAAMEAQLKEKESESGKGTAIG